MHGVFEICIAIFWRTRTLQLNLYCLVPWCTADLGYSHHHIRFPGTLTSTTETFMTMLEETIHSLVVHGFRKFLVLNSHGGNNPPISVLLQRLMEKYDSDEAEIYSRFAWAGDAELSDFRLQGTSGHAGETETSMMLHLRPDLVKTDQFGPDGEEVPALNPTGASGRWRVDQMTRHGQVGDPRTSTAEKGKKILDACIDDVARTCRSIRENDPFSVLQLRKAEKHRGLWGKL